MKQTILKEVNKFNNNTQGDMSVKWDGAVCTLFIEGNEITSGWDFEVLGRIRQINRENGLQFFED